MTVHSITRGGRGNPPPPAPPDGKPVLRTWKRLDVEQARQFLAELDGRTRAADLQEAMFLLGRLAGHAQALLDVLDSVVTP